MVADALTQRTSVPLPETWSLWRYRHVAGLLRQSGRPTRSLIDLGCGAGNVTRYLAAELGVSGVLGVEQDPVQSRSARGQGLEILRASLLDDTVREKVGRLFDVAVLGDVLHHLAGSTIDRSRARARQALSQAVSLLEEGGTLVIAEPLYRSRWLRNGTYRLKGWVSRWRRERLELGPSWLNIGPPVVRYFDRGELLALLASSGLRVLSVVESDQQRLGGIFARSRITLLAQPARSTSRSTSTATRSPDSR